jgi:hypothetical protein
MEMGGPLPEEYIPPTIEAPWFPYWRAYHALSGDRQWIAGGMGPPSPQRLPYRAKREYAKDHGLGDNGDLDDFLMIVDRIDDEFLRWHKDERSKAANTGPGRVPQR